MGQGSSLGWVLGCSKDARCPCFWPWAAGGWARSWRELGVWFSAGGKPEGLMKWQASRAPLNRFQFLWVFTLQEAIFKF